MNTSRTLTFTIGPFALAVALALLPGLHAAGGDRALTDSNVRDAIEDELLFDGAVPVNDVDVSVSDGIATLTGTVDTLLAKERAAKIAGTVKGVRSVVNRIDIETRSARSGEQIRADVTSALLADPAADSYEVDVAVDGGTVTLSGKVDSWQEKTLTETVAKSVRGVTAVRNELEVEYGMSRPDHEMKAEIEKALEWDVLVDDGLIEVEVSDGTAALSGIVGSAAEKNRAIADAWVIGITSVEADGLRVERWARDEELRSHKYVPRTDEEIRRAVEDAMLRDPRVSSFDVTTEVEDGIVTLRGNVGYLKAKRAAEQDAWNTVGVVRVENRIKVRPVNMLLDADIRSDVVDALIRDSVVESYEIDVAVRRGEVVLEGEVDSHYEKMQAGDVAARVPGVVRVENDIEVDYDDRLSLYDPYVDPYWNPRYDWDLDRPRSIYRSDAEIQREIESEMFWSPFVDADEVQVSVDGGVATLTGTVDTWWEASVAVENAFEGGAIGVENDLRVASMGTSDD